MAWVRLVRGKAVAASDRRETVGYAQCFQQQPRRTFRLVGAHGEGPAIGSQLVERVGYTRVKPRVFGHPAFIIGQVVRTGIRVRHAARRLESAVDKRLQPVANHGRHVGLRKCRQAARRQCAVHRGGNVGHRIGQRAVEIENERAHTQAALRMGLL